MSYALMKKREQGQHLIAVIGDEDTVTGFMLGGIGHINNKRESNYLIVDSKTKRSDIEKAFLEFTTREDVIILLISQFIAEDIRYLVDEFDKPVPAILEIPSKEHPFDPEKDSIMVRINRMIGAKNEVQLR